MIIYYTVMEGKAMQKDFISAFSCFVKFETDQFSKSNLNPKINSASVLAKILQKKYGSKCKTQIHKNDFENTRLWN